MAEVEFDCGACGCLFEGYLDGGLEVSPLLGSSALALEAAEASPECAAEECSEDVLHVDAEAAEVCAAEDVLLAVCAADARVTIGIVFLLLLGVAEDCVCFAYLLELFLACGVLVPVGVEFEC
jgi:hypothetical protein